ncbi:hypothetical protein U9M48_004435 [Paspalum notatum var. saurae]|uniref:Integrase zinc-binding domain-containing protein n=1 Tax=Paspalum notatum var. saurae TaxID=547442 RepID=A0AAQ3PJY0_PASNO
MTLQALSSVKPQRVQEAQQLLAQLAVSSPDSEGYNLENGLIRYRGKLWVGNNMAIQTKIIAGLHDSAIGGNSSINATYYRVKQHFLWTGLKQDVENYVKQCTTCHQAKHTLTHPAGLLNPLPIPSGVWQDLSMDYIDGLPKSEGYSTIMVVVDRLTKAAHFIAVKHPYTASTILPKPSWIPLFVCMVHDASPHNWKSWLPLAELRYNSTYHSTLGYSPFKALFGYEPNLGVSTTVPADTPTSVVALAETIKMGIRKT